MMRHLRPIAAWTVVIVAGAWALLLIELRRTVPSGPAVQMPVQS